VGVHTDSPNQGLGLTVEMCGSVCTPTVHTDLAIQTPEYRK